MREKKRVKEREESGCKTRHDDCVYVRACVKIEMRRRRKKQNRVRTEAQTDIKKEKRDSYGQTFISIFKNYNKIPKALLNQKPTTRSVNI